MHVVLGENYVVDQPVTVRHRGLNGSTENAFASFTLHASCDVDASVIEDLNTVESHIDRIAPV